MSGLFWLSSYPKSGNTWVRALLTNFRGESDKPADINELDVGGAAFGRNAIDHHTGIDTADMSHDQINYYRPLVYDQMAANSKDTRFLKLHDAYLLNSEGNPIFPKSATAGVIYIVRNPLDVVVSYAHHRNKSIENTIEFLANDLAYLDGTNLPGRQLPQLMLSWSGHVKSWVDQTELDTIVIRYEDLIRDTEHAFRRIIKFVGFELNEERLRKSVSFSRFEELQKQEKALGFREKQPTAESFFRRGTSGTWKDSLDERQIKAITDAHGEVMERFGYSAAI